MENISVDDILLEAKRRGKDTSQIEGKLRAKFGQTGIPAPEKKQLPQQPNINELITRSIGSKNIGQYAGDFISTLGGANPTKDSNEFSDLIAKEAIKKQFEDPIDRELKVNRNKALKAGITTDESGNIIRTSDLARDERERRLHDFESRRQAGTLRGELNQNQYVKRFQEMNSAATGIDAILRDTISRKDNKSKNIGDQALITLYNKILDPMSVVRESEYARTPDGQALLNRIQGFVEKVKAGGSGLTDADRMEIARAAKVLINNSGELYNQKISDYENLAGAYGADPNLVISGFQRFSPYNIDDQVGDIQQLSSSGQQENSSVQNIQSTSKGNKFRIIQ